MTDFSLRIHDSMMDILSSAENPTPQVRLNRVSPFKHTQFFPRSIEKHIFRVTQVQQIYCHHDMQL